MNIIAITACPTGVAHTYLAEANLKKHAKKMGLNILVETQGAVESEYTFTDRDIRSADIVVIAADKVIDLSRFRGKKLIEVSVTRAAKDAAGLLQDIVSGAIPARIYASDAPAEVRDDATDNHKSLLSQIYVHLITGVNMMIPFVVAGGILIALSFSFGITAATPGDPNYHPIAKMLSDIGGGAAFALMLPILSLGISKSIMPIIRPNIAALAFPMLERKVVSA